MEKNLVIVGIDPGISTAVAILSLDQELIALRSDKGLSKEEIDRFIVEHGKPLIIASDMEKTPSLIKRVVSTFNAKIYSCKARSFEEKRKFVEKYFKGLKDPHSFDAVFAALLALKEYGTKFAEVKNKLKRLQRAELFGEVIEKILKNPNLNVESALEQIEGYRGKGVKKERNWKRLYFDAKENLRKKEQKLKELSELVKRIEQENIILRKKLEKGQDKVGIEIFRDKEIKKLEFKLKAEKKKNQKFEREIEQLNNNISKLKKLIERTFSKWIPAKRVFNAEELSNAKFSAVIIPPELEREKFSENIDLIICDNPERIKSDAVVLKRSKVEMECFEDFCVINPESLGDWKERFLKWLNKYKTER